MDVFMLTTPLFCGLCIVIVVMLSENATKDEFVLPLASLAYSVIFPFALMSRNVAFWQAPGPLLSETFEPVVFVNQHLSSAMSSLTEYASDILEELYVMFAGE